MSVLWRGFGIVELVTSGALATAAAFAVLPGYLRASEHTRIAKAGMEMQRTGIALESYFVMHGAYPPSGAAEGMPGQGEPQQQRARAPESAAVTGVRTVNSFAKPGAGARRLVTFRVPDIERGEAFATLTSPIAFLEQLPSDPFAYTEGASLGYFTNEGAVRWILFSLGPDRDENAASGPGDINGNLETLAELNTSRPAKRQASATLSSLTYDPSNGTLSSGDIWRVRRP
jgi:Tfp pilus assembly protein PilE